MPRNIHVWCLLNTAGYLFMDFLVIAFGFEKWAPIDKQSMLHHILGFTNMWAAMWQQDYTCIFGVAMLFLEISTPYTCLRWLFFAHGKTGVTCF